ncbi:MAG: prolyl oligopeptidase family serine peptidase [Bdellovibrionota bacterium]
MTTSKDQKLSHLDYLEIVEGSEALSFAKKNNAYSDARLKSDKRYQPAYDKILKIVSAKDKLPAFYLMNDEIYDFWQDDIHIKGILRKTSIKSLNSGKPKWTIILDIDALAKSENENWVYKGFNCLEPEYTLCMMSLSRGGKDASTMREFNLKTKQFVKDGFYIPESKSQIAWVDENTLLVGDGANTTTLTTSGYPSQIKVLQRGTELKSAPIVFKTARSSVSAYAFSKLIDKKRLLFIGEHTSFFEATNYVFDISTSKLMKIPIPATANFEGLFQGQFLFITKQIFESKNEKFPAGSLLSFSASELEAKNPKITPVFVPNEVSFYENSTFSKNHLWVMILNDVKKQLLKYSLKSDKWTSEDVSFAGSAGNESVSAAQENSNHVYLSYSDFLTPTSIFYLNETSKNKAKLALKSPARFKSDQYNISQYKVNSKDGTLIPYFVVSNKKIKLTGKNPTLLYGYGGFELAMTSNYLGTTGKVWLEKGGVYVLSNIRGGGEYGPNWHRSALRENRHKAYEDFYAIAEDLIKRKLTSPKHLGIRGGSNGGLLTSVAFTQRPELFNAVISEVPLANMLEYHHWLAGASWMEEYGDPDDSKMRKYLLSYSPLHNLQKDKKYPEVFYLTSTKDDRVHPGHARQMVARMQELGHPVLYNENTDGGHGRASNMKDLAEFLALEFTYLYQKLMD